MLATVALVGVGAAAGAVLRYYLTLWAAARFGTAFPYGTLLINVSGSFVLGCFMTMASSRLDWPPELRLLVATGWCGGFTTFSTLSYDTVVLATSGNAVLALLNSVVSLGLGMGAVLLGMALGRALGG